MTRLIRGSGEVFQGGEYQGGVRPKHSITASGQRGLIQSCPRSDRFNPTLLEFLKKCLRINCLAQRARSSLRPSSAQKSQPALRAGKRGKEAKRQELIGPRNTETEAEVVEPVRRGVPVADRGAKELWTAAPGTAPQHAPGTIARGPGSAIARRSIVVGVITILGPFQHVAMHIVKTKGVSRVAPHRPRFACTHRRRTTGIRGCRSIIG